MGETLIDRRGESQKDNMDMSIEEVLRQLTLLEPASREDMKETVTELLAGPELKVIDTHNTKSMMFVFAADGERYGLKMEYGDAKVTRDEAQWYELAPDALKKHYIGSHSADSYAFLLLRWLEQAKTIEQIAAENEGDYENPTIQLVLEVLKRDQLLFESSPTVPLESTATSSYFYDKYRSYNAEAAKYPYLQKLIDSPTVQVNGREMPGPERLVTAIQQDDKLRTYLSPDKAGLVHGDPHAGNVLVEDGEIYLVDPKGTDPLPFEYDTGRIFWSLTGWNAIVQGEFSLSGNLEDGYQLDVTERQQYVDGRPRVKEVLSEQEYHRALYASAMQYLTRVSHAAVEPEATALYLRGLQVMTDLLEEMDVDIEELVR